MIAERPKRETEASARGCAAAWACSGGCLGRRKDNGEPEWPLQGPGNVDLVDTAGNPFPNSEKGFSLCRCGHSNNKPLCDGSHARVAFKADTKAPVPGGPASPSGS